MTTTTATTRPEVKLKPVKKYEFTKVFKDIKEFAEYYYKTNTK